MTAVTFDEFERRADRTMALVYGLKHARNVALCAAAMGLVNWSLRRLLLKSLSPEMIDALTPEQASELTKKLQELHSQLVRMLRNCAHLLRSHYLFRSSIAGLEESTENLGDVIEDLVFAANPKFRTLVSDSLKAITQAESVGLVGRM